MLGDSVRTKILEQLVGFNEDFLSVNEISRMAEVPYEIVNINIDQLKSIGILKIKKEGISKFKLNPNDERVLALNLIETHEFLRKSKNSPFEKETLEKNYTSSYDLNLEENNLIANECTIETSF